MSNNNSSMADDEVSPLCIPHILDQVFGYLPPKDLKSSRKVNQDWNLACLRVLKKHDGWKIKVVGEHLKQFTQQLGDRLPLPGTTDFKGRLEICSDLELLYRFVFSVSDAHFDAYFCQGQL